MLLTGPTWINRTLSGRYQIESLLGRGGMSSVYKAADPNLHRDVAIKMIHPHLTDNLEFIKRFEQEAAAVAQLRHANIVQVHDFNHDNDVYYMVLEFIPGETLARKLEALNNAGLRMPLTDIIRILATICDAVDYAHQRRMIHRDLKPSNVIINLLGEPILMDFGIAKIIGGDIHTASGAAVGTAAYMSPEQVRGEETDHRADIYSLGIILYEMLSGEPPYQGDSTYQIMLKHINEPVPDIQAVDANTPHSLVAILEKALSKNPGNRFQTAAEMATALRTVGLQMQGPLDTFAARHLDRLSSLWQEAHDLLEDRNFSACVRKLDELKRADADYRREKVKQLREEALNRLHEHATRSFQSEKFNESLSALAELRDCSPNYPGINELEAQVQAGIRGQALRGKLDHLYEEATAYLDKHAYEQALAKWEEVQHRQGNSRYPDRLQVEKRAREGICARYYNQAVTALAAGHPGQALALWEQTCGIDPVYPDRQDVAARAQAMLNRRQRKRAGVIRLGVVAGLLVLALGGFWLTNRASPPTPTVAAEDTAASPTAAVISAVITPTQTVAATATATTLPAAATAVPSSTPSPTSTPTPTPTATVTESPTPLATDVATALLPSSIYAAPHSDSEELTIISAGDEVAVLGRSANGNWLYVRDEEGNIGFIFSERMEWPGDVKTLIIIETAPPATSTPAGATGAPLEIDLWQLDGTERCEEGKWYQSVFIQGRGGDGIYTYFWNNEQVGGPTGEGFAFEISSAGSSVQGTGTVVSGDGQTVSGKLHIPRPDCGG